MPNLLINKNGKWEAVPRAENNMRVVWKENERAWRIENEELKQEIKLLKERLATRKQHVVDGKRNSPGELIIRWCSRTGGLRRGEIKSDRRFKHIVRWRQYAMYLIHHYTTLSLPQIGRLLGGKDHTTVLYAIRKIKHLMEDYPHEFPEFPGIDEVAHEEAMLKLKRGDSNGQL